MWGGKLELRKRLTLLSCSFVAVEVRKTPTEGTMQQISDSPNNTDLILTDDLKQLSTVCFLSLPYFSPHSQCKKIHANDNFHDQ